MANDNDTIFDILRAIGFVMAVLIGGLFIAGFLDGWNEAKTGDERPVESAPSEPREAD